MEQQLGPGVFIKTFYDKTQKRQHKVPQWETGHGGGFWAAGVGGPITGKGFHLGIIDDPLKNAEEAASEVIREKQKEWYRSTFYTRAEPNAAIIGIQTRWHEDDLSGWLLSEEVGEQPERWHIVNLPAIAEPGPTYPASCTVGPDWREEGDALCEERYSVERLRQIESRVGPYYWNALFQQRPTAKEGDFFKVSKIETVAEVPSNLTLCRGWDLAGTEGGGAFTAAVLLGKDATGVWYVVDVQRGQWSTDDVETQLVSIARADGQRVKIHLPQDPGQAGKKQAVSFGRLLAGFNAVIEPVTGSKETRAFSFSAQVNLGNVKVLQAGWTKAFLEELRQFPRGKFKDQVDAASDAFNELAGQKQFNQGTWFR
jgi:predicted phage terminase large subunit-like protein